MMLDNVRQTKALIYCACHMLLLHGTSIEAGETFDTLFELVQRPLTIPPVDVEVQKLQMGSIDCLGVFIKTALDALPLSAAPRAVKSLIEEITDRHAPETGLVSHHAAHFTDKLTALVNISTNPKQTILNLEIDTQFKICIINAFISSLKMLTPNTVDSLTSVIVAPTEKAFYTSTNAPLKSSYLQVFDD